MRFCEELKRYMEIIGCSATELSRETGISNADISRYISGKREPEPESEYIKKLSDALYILADEKTRNEYLQLYMRRMFS